MTAQNSQRRGPCLHNEGVCGLLLSHLCRYVIAASTTQQDALQSCLNWSSRPSTCIESPSRGHYKEPSREHTGLAIMNGVKGGVEAMSVEKGAKGFQVWWRCWLLPILRKQKNTCEDLAVVHLQVPT